MLCQNDGIRVCFFDSLAEITPELMVEFRAVPQICCNIKSPAICIVRWRYPFFPDLQDIAVEILRALVIEFRQCIMPPPAFVSTIIRPLVFIIKMKIIVIWAVCCFIGSRCIALVRAIDLFPIQPFIKGTTMIKDTIQDHTDASGMCLCDKIRKELIGCLQIFLCRHTIDKTTCPGIVPCTFRQGLPLV